MEGILKMIFHHGYRAVVCIMVGVFYVFLVMFLAMLASGGEGSGEAMMGFIFGLPTSPLVMVGAWLLFPRKAFRVAFCLVAVICLLPLLATAAVVFNDLVWNPPDY